MGVSDGRTGQGPRDREIYSWNERWRSQREGETGGREGENLCMNEKKKQLEERKKSSERAISLISFVQ